MFNAQHNPLLARSRRNRGLALSIAAGLAILAGGTIAVSAQTPANTQQARAEQPAQIASSEIRGTQAAQPEKRRNVRVIPLFNTPVNPTGK